jgi:hypothetical protein
MPARSSPNLRTTPTTTADGAWRRWKESTVRTTRSAGLLAATSLAGALALTAPTTRGAAVSPFGVRQRSGGMWRLQ